MSFGPLAPGASIGGQFRQLCTYTPMVPGVDAYGQSKPTAGTAVQYIPCDLQPMSSTRSMVYKAVNAASLFDLHLPIRREGQSAALTIGIHDRFAVDGVTYRAIGAGMRQGNSGVQVVPVEVLP